jgi:hypothetical protein
MATPLHISRDLQLTLEDLIGQCIAILGIRGSGKSNTAGVIFEELLQNNYPLSIVDLEGEYFGLKEKYEVLVVGTGDAVEIEIDANCAAEIAQVSMERNVPVVLDLSGFLSEERTELLKAYLSSLWNLAGVMRKPYMIGIEEAHEFIPQGVKTELKEMIARIALRGRKRGLGGIVVSQRSAKVDKDVLSQAGMLFLHRVVHEVDMRVYSELLPWRKGEVKEIINGLDTGDCIYLSGDQILPIYVRERTTFHAGFTPTLGAVETPELKSVSASIIETIERARGAKGPTTAAEKMENRIEQLERMLEKKDARIGELEDVARTLGYIKLEVPPLVLGAWESREAMCGQEIPDRALPVVVAKGRPALEIAGSEVGIEQDEGLSAETETDSMRTREDQDDLLPPAVSEHIDRWVHRCAREQILHRRVLAFLVEHAPGAYSAHQIAAWTRFPPGLIEDEPPSDLLRSGLIERERRAAGTLYRSSVRSFVNREFRVFQPDIGDRGLHHVAQTLRDRLARIA